MSDLAHTSELVRSVMPARIEGELAPILLAAPKAAKFCGVAESTFWKLNAAGRIPRARALGRRRLWSRAELMEWVEAGCPSRDRWEALQSGRTGREARR